MSRPNLIYVFADQLRYQSCGYAGDTRAHTPNIDALAQESVNFCNAVSGHPVCAPYRASLFTGKYTTSTGMVINEIRMLPTHHCLAHVLTEGGYETAYIGKWHLWANELGNHYLPRNSFVPPGPYRLGFDGYWAAYNFHHLYLDAYYHTDSPKKIVMPGYEPDGQTELAIAQLRRASESGKPIALFLSYGTPHSPWTADNVPPSYMAQFRDVEFSSPPNYKPRNDPYADRWARFKRGERKLLRKWMRGYYAMTSNLDWNLGRLLQAIDALGMRDNTIFVFTSDHGEMFGAQGRRAKNIFYEEAVRVPFLMRWPRHIPAGSISEACLNTPDIMPTLLALLGLSIPAAVEGMDLSHCTVGEIGPEPEAAFMQGTGATAAWVDGHEWRALRDRRYTYAIYRRDGQELLFDHQSDLYQLHNLVGDPTCASMLERFRALLLEKCKTLNDDFETCTWYRDNWTEDRIIVRTATMR
ncbi:MAG: sulfatase [Anaerolineae bacterium]|nr:sulfatase [Anaerolineae bacterium]